MSDILQRIVAVKREELVAARAVLSEAALRKARPPHAASPLRCAPSWPQASRR